MKVKELIECLKTFDQEKEIVFETDNNFCTIYEDNIRDDMSWITIGYE